MTRTVPNHSGPNPDALDGMGRQLLALARTGLVTSRIIERETSKKLGLLLGFASESSEPRKQAEELIDLVVKACAELGPGPLGESARKYYGTELGEREFPFERRHASAACAWDSDIEVESWDRRHRREVITEVEHQILSIKQREAQSKLRAANAQSYLPPPADPREAIPNPDYERLEVRAETHIIGNERRPLFTDWHYRDFAVRGGRQYHRIYTTVEARVTIESLCDFVEVERELGVNQYGYQIWVVRFLNPPEEGATYEWSIRKHFNDKPDVPIDRDWLALAVSNPNGIDRGTFIVNMEQAKEVPKRFARFITPKMTLPVLRGPVWDLPESNELRRTVTFEYLAPWYSHGIYWWWE